MTFNQPQGMFRTHKTYETACTYLVVASKRKADEATNRDTFFDAVGEVASWLSAPDEHLLAFESREDKSHCLLGSGSMRACDSNPTTGLVQSGESALATFAPCCLFKIFRGFTELNLKSNARGN